MYDVGCGVMDYSALPANEFGLTLLTPAMEVERSKLGFWQAPGVGDRLLSQTSPPEATSMHSI